MIISLLVVGLVATRVGHIPGFLSLESVSENVQAVLSEAQIQSVLQGKETQVFFDQGKRILSVGEELSGTLPQRTCTLPADLEIEFTPPIPTEGPCYRFFPDGSGAGSLLTLKLKGHTRILRVSPLTGIAFAEEPEND